MNSYTNQFQLAIKQALVTRAPLNTIITPLKRETISFASVSLITQFADVIDLTYDEKKI